jgi:hypothetical protein
MSRAAAAVFSLLLLCPPAGAAPAGDATAASLTPARLDALVTEISGKVEDIRKLKFKTPVKGQIISGAAARDSFKAKIKPWEVEQARFTQKAYIHLGLIPPSTQLITDYLDLAEQDVLGYYDTETKKMYVLAHVPEDEVRAVLAHELTHALEDQHYDFQAVAKRANGDDDHATAISAVIEGSATAMMISFMVRDARENGAAKASERVERTESKRAKRLKGAPTFVQQTVILPYILGFTFMFKGSPWLWQEGIAVGDLDLVYTNPPLTTQQILHPERYWWGNWRKQPPPLQLNDLTKTLGGGWTKAAQGSIGELGLAVLTGSRLDLEKPEALLPSRWTNDAAIGTMGDVYHHYVNGEQSVTALMTRWESMRDAEQFDKALINRGRYFLRYGVHVLVLAGDVEGRGPDLAAAAMQGVSYWQQR